MSHVHHESLPDYVEGALFQDGCDECERRAANFSIAHMDRETWAKIRLRAMTFQLSGLTNASQCELRLLRVIGEVLLMERAHLVTLETARKA